MSKQFKLVVMNQDQLCSKCGRTIDKGTSCTVAVSKTINNDKRKTVRHGVYCSMCITK